MLFDLRGRGRRRTVQGVYLGLAILMGAGLVLFGVGTGTGGGGLLNGIGGGGSGNAAKQTISQAEKNAQKATVQQPNSATAWAALAQVRFDSAAQEGNFDSTTGTYTAAGKKELASATQAWQRYLQLAKQPDPNLAQLVAPRAARNGDYTTAAQAWEFVTAANPTTAKYFECLAAASYAAKETRKADLATAKALSLVPKAQRPLILSALQRAKTQPSPTTQC
jgi:tetratricopeptide (TPR) repeat protein